MARAVPPPNAPRLGRPALATALVALAASFVGPRTALAAPPRPAAATQGSARPAAPGSIRATHVVTEGQTLGHVALRYSVSVEELQKANGLRSDQVLRAGTRLAIPVHGAALAPPAAAAKTGATVHASLATASRFTAPAPGGAPKGSVRIALGSDVWQGRVRAGKGKLAPQALEGFSRILRFGPSNKRIAINPRLVEAVAAVSDHFGGRTLRVVSGYRPPSPRQHTPHSRHNVGAAVDFIVEGVPNEVVRDFCRTLPNVGVGYYPNSSFVHLDARTVSTFWVDYSGPGERPRYAGPDGQDPDSHDEDGGGGLDLPFGRSTLLAFFAADFGPARPARSSGPDSEPRVTASPGPPSDVPLLREGKRRLGRFSGLDRGGRSAPATPTPTPTPGRSPRLGRAGGGAWPPKRCCAARSPTLRSPAARARARWIEFYTAGALFGHAMGFAYGCR